MFFSWTSFSASLHPSEDERATRRTERRVEPVIFLAVDGPDNLSTGRSSTDGLFKELLPLASLHSDPDSCPLPSGLTAASADVPRPQCAWSSEDACGIDHGDPEWHVLGPQNSGKHTEE